MAKKAAKRRPRRAPKMYPKGAPTSSTAKARQGHRQVDHEPARETSDTMSGDELREEYWYVANDLKRILVIASTLFVVLIVLSFVL